MSKTLLNNYIWLLDTIHRAGKITFEEINQKWLKSALSEGKDLPLRTFHNWREKVQDIFDINIECNKSANEYYIENAEYLQSNSVQSWLLNTFTVSNLLQESAQLKNRISLENVPSGLQFLTEIIDCMKENTQLRITYQSYHQPNPSTFLIAPFAVKLFKQRWYVIAESEIEELWIYALDRIKSVEKTSDKFTFPIDFDADAYFAECYGIINDQEMEATTIKLKVSQYQSNYFRDLPLHHSQKETEKTEDYSIFELYLKPTYDFIQEILKYGQEVEVLSPENVRSKVKTSLKNSLKRY